MPEKLFESHCQTGYPVKQHVDPEVRRWNRLHPRFPGVSVCAELLNSPKTRGTWVDLICAELVKNAPEYCDDLVDVTRKELSAGSRCCKLLLHALADAKVDAAMDLFAELLYSPDVTIRPIAVDALKQLGTKEARRLLFEYGVDW